MRKFGGCPQTGYHIDGHHGSKASPHLTRPLSQVHKAQDGPIPDPTSPLALSPPKGLRLPAPRPRERPRKARSGGRQSREPLASRVGARKRRGGHRKGVAGTRGAGSWKEGVARWAHPRPAGRRPGRWEGRLQPLETLRCPSGLKATHCPRFQGAVASGVHTAHCVPGPVGTRSCPPAQ